MSDEAEGTTEPGCAALDFGNALAWKWTREMPRGLKGGFLTLLYAARAMASASGELRYARNGKPFRIQDIAGAAGCREQDARRYLEAAALAGVVLVLGERRRGRRTLYALALCPAPDWAAAAEYLKETARPRKEPDDGSSGHSGTTSTGGEVRATEARTGEDGVRATEARPSSGHRGTNGSGHRGPNVPGVSQVLPQEPTSAGGQPQDAGAHASSSGAAPSEEKDASSGEAAPGPGPSAVPRPARGGALGKRCQDPACGVPLIRGGDWCSLHRPGAEEARRPQGPVQGAFTIGLPSSPAAPRPAAQSPIPVPREDPSAPPRVCGCGRTYRTAQAGPCPDCVAARLLEQAGTG